MLTEAELKKFLVEHFEAERQRDLGWLRRTVTDNCEYDVIGPWYPDDPERQSRATTGRDAVSDLWSSYYEKFRDYKIEWNEDEMIVWPERNTIFAQVWITATPTEDFEGFPAGKPICASSGAVCVFDDSGELRKETVFGSFGKFMADVRRMREFLGEVQAVRSIDKTSWD